MWRVLARHNAGMAGWMLECPAFCLEAAHRDTTAGRLDRFYLDRRDGVAVPGTYRMSNAPRGVKPARCGR